MPRRRRGVPASCRRGGVARPGVVARLRRHCWRDIVAGGGRIEVGVGIVGAAESCLAATTSEAAATRRLAAVWGERERSRSERERGRRRRLSPQRCGGGGGGDNDARETTARYDGGVGAGMPQAVAAKEKPRERSIGEKTSKCW
uniref:Uncharacterized protein n=1 Tax=Oryza sativa subsp. japonica TaxID=39947 RepID=Q5Z8S5_ORYSJ|nr:hypothetical protein [Oryza sativa Japonica Group]